ncbi:MULTISPECIES: hypothetical protein [Luteimonas]|uniref:hypothetical protein n=1 Tax=Luteimonas TaxID=83614 RepID=UPI000C7E3291|nr:MULTISPECIES: hypothetical protein [Luteimonas]
MNLRIVIGLAVSVVLQMLLGALATGLFPPAPSGTAPLWTALQAGAIALLASGAGAYAARQPFLRAALVLWAVGWVSSVLVLQRLGGAGLTFADAATPNAMAIVVSGLATVLGARLGWRLYRQAHPAGHDAR